MTTAGSAVFATESELLDCNIKRATGPCGALALVVGQLFFYTPTFQRNDKTARADFVVTLSAVFQNLP